MEFKFSKGGEENSQAEPMDDKNNQRAILVLLLLLVGGFSYIYFFTGIIKPLEVTKPAEAPSAAQIVKMPLPPGDANSAKADPKPVVAKNEVSLPAKTEPPRPSGEKSAAPDKKSEPAKTAVKKVPALAASKPKLTPAKSLKPLKSQAGSTAATGAWSIMAGTYVLEDALSADMGRLRKAGLDPVIKPGARKKSVMNRLFLSEFADRADAKAALGKLKLHTSDAFILDQAGRHTVYAGSYLLDARAAFEMERLSAAGFPVTLKRVEVAIPSRSLTVGPFNNKKAADAALSKLQSAGVKATLFRQ
jgi:cell division septation protein DedD